MIARIAVCVILLTPSLAAAQTCVDSAVKCTATGRWVSVPCNASVEQLVAACGGNAAMSGSGGGSNGGNAGGKTVASELLIEIVGGAIGVAKGNHEQMLAAFAREDWDRAAEGMPWRPSPGCAIALDRISASTESFAKEGEEYSLSFTKEEFKRTVKAMGKKDDSKSGYRKAYDQMKKWADQVQTWSKDLSAWVACRKDEGCNLLDLLKQVNADVRKWLAESDRDSAEAAGRVEKAAKFLEDYGRRIAAENERNATQVAACLGK